MEQSYNWITNCINSCTNEWQLESCKKLIDLFTFKYDDYKLTGDLILKLSNKQDII